MLNWLTHGPFSIFYGLLGLVTILDETGSKPVISCWHVTVTDITHFLTCTSFHNCVAILTIHLSKLPALLCHGWYGFWYFNNLCFSVSFFVPLKMNEVVFNILKILQGVYQSLLHFMPFILTDFSLLNFFPAILAVLASLDFSFTDVCSNWSWILSSPLSFIPASYCLIQHALLSSLRFNFNFTYFPSNFKPFLQFYPKLQHFLVLFSSFFCLCAQFYCFNLNLSLIMNKHKSVEIMMDKTLVAPNVPQMSSISEKSFHWLINKDRLNIFLFHLNKTPIVSR